MNRTTVHLRESQTQAIEDIVQQTQIDPEKPSLSQSEAIRKLLDAGLEETDLGDLVSEAAIVAHREEQFTEKGSEGWLRNQRTGFETQVHRHFKSRFENGYTPEELEEWAENMRQKAYNYWPVDVGPDYSDRREEALAFVDEQLEKAKSAAEDNDFDHFEFNYTAVESGRSRDDLDTMIEDAVERIEEAGAQDDDALTRVLAKQHDAPEELAREAVEAAREEVDR